MQVTPIRVSLILHLCATVILLSFGVVYLVRGEFMPYHAVAVSRSWAEVDPAMQVLLLALMKVTAGGWIASSLALLVILLIPFRSGQRWSFFAVPIVGSILGISSLLVTLRVRALTPANPPWIAAAVGLGLLLAASLVSVIEYRRTEAGKSA
jgi:hypothetical protein